ncbi:MAG: hypothetical protein ACR2P3_12910 [Geminicoccaceae bacterium]
MSSALAGIARSGTVHVLFAFTVMGSWAIFANKAHPMPKPLIVGFVQGMLSALITLFLKIAIDRMARRLTGIAALFVPPIIACSVSLCALITIHWLSGTPEIIKTIALPFSIAASYASLYCYSLRSMQRHT